MKKKGFIGLSTLFLVLLLGLSSTCYADVYRDFTKEDLKNIIYNGFLARNQTVDNIETYMQSFSDTDLEDIAEEMNAYNYTLVAVTPASLCIRCGNTNNTTSSTTYLTTGDGRIINSNSSYYIYGKDINMNQNSSRFGQITNATNSNVQLLKGGNSSYTNVFYSSYNIYRNATGGNSIGNPPIYQPNSDVFNGPYTGEQEFEFLPNSFYQYTINVQGNNQTFIKVDKTAFSSYLLGQLLKSEITGGIYRDFYVYDTYNRGWTFLRDNVEYNEDWGPISKFFNTDYTSNDYAVSDIYIKGSLLIPNTYFRYQFFPINADFNDYIDVWFYVCDNNTKFVGNMVIPDTTFSGDYIDEYNKQIGNFRTDLDTDITNNAIEKGIEDVLNTNYSGDIVLADIVGTFDLIDPTDNLFNQILQGITNVFIGTYEPANLIIDLPYLNVRYTIRSDFFVLPVAFRTFVSAGLIFIFFKAWYSKLRSIYHVLSSGDITGFGKIALIGLNIDDLL